MDTFMLLKNEQTYFIERNLVSNTRNLKESLQPRYLATKQKYQYLILQEKQNCTHLYAVHESQIRG